MRNFKFLIFATIIISCTLFLFSCKKDTLLTSGGSIAYNVDTFMFDTVFTQQGSSTRILKIFNKEKRRINISYVRFKNGENSRFYFNINGKEGRNARDINILAKDSIYAFLGVNIDPTNEDEPFVVYDELIVTVNGKDFILPIIAYGQNAIYIVDSTLETQTWDSKKPYVIINNAYINKGATLTIAKGTKVYVHGNSRLFVIGSLKIDGTLEDPVVFQGDRLDRLTYIGDHFGVSGEWGGLYFTNTSYNNQINYAIFKNGGASTKLGEQSTMAATIQLDKDSVRSSTPKLKITNSKILNSQGYGILAFNSTMYAENLLVAECGSENIALIEGGNYEINNSTFTTFGWDHLVRNNARVASFTNFLAIDQTNYTAAPLNVVINNSIIWGSFEGELLCSKVNDVNAEIKINNSLIKYKTDEVEPFTQIQNCIVNENPLFKVVPSGSNYNDWDFRLTEPSPAKHKGIQIGLFTTDLNGVTRNNPPSMGCYEFVNE